MYKHSSFLWCYVMIVHCCISGQRHKKWLWLFVLASKLLSTSDSMLPKLITNGYAEIVMAVVWIIQNVLCISDQCPVCRSALLTLIGVLWLRWSCQVSRCQSWQVIFFGSSTAADSWLTAALWDVNLSRHFSSPGALHRHWAPPQAEVHTYKYITSRNEHLNENKFKSWSEMVYFTHK